jgi:hypothetical protein
MSNVRAKLVGAACAVGGVGPLLGAFAGPPHPASTTTAPRTITATRRVDGCLLDCDLDRSLESKRAARSAPPDS